MLFLCGKCNTLAVNVWVSTTRNTTEWSMAESALNRCPTLKSCFVWHLYDRIENENVKCVFAFAFWVPNFIWFLHENRRKILIYLATDFNCSEVYGVAYSRRDFMSKTKIFKKFLSYSKTRRRNNQISDVFLK